MSVQNPVVPKNHNALLTATGWGSIYVKVKAIDHGIFIVSDTSVQRFSRSLYVKKRAGGSFTLAIVCSTYAEYKALGDWIRGYGQIAADPDGAVGPVRVMVPDRKFDKIAIPQSVSFGDNYSAVTYKISIAFVGANDPVPHSADFVSSFSMPAAVGTDLPYFYPAGRPLTGTVDALYDPDVKVGFTQNYEDRLAAKDAAQSIPQSLQGISEGE